MFLIHPRVTIVVLCILLLLYQRAKTMKTKTMKLSSRLVSNPLYIFFSFIFCLFKIYFHILFFFLCKFYYVSFLPLDQKQICQDVNRLKVKNKKKKKQMASIHEQSQWAIKCVWNDVILLTIFKSKIVLNKNVHIFELQFADVNDRLTSMNKFFNLPNNLIQSYWPRIRVQCI